MAEILEKQGLSVGVVNARFIKPLDRDALEQASHQVELLVTLEENSLAGGFGEGVLDLLNRLHRLRECRVLNLGIPDLYVPHGKRERLLQDLKLDPEGAAGTILAAWKEEL